MLSLKRRRDMVMPRRFGGFYKIAGPGVAGPNSLVTISTYCAELSSASYIQYHLRELKSQLIRHVKYRIRNLQVACLLLNSGLGDLDKENYKA